MSRRSSRGPSDRKTAERQPCETRAAVAIPVSVPRSRAVSASNAAPPAPHFAARERTDPQWSAPIGIAAPSRRITDPNGMRSRTPSCVVASPPCWLRANGRRSLGRLRVGRPGDRSPVARGAPARRAPGAVSERSLRCCACWPPSPRGCSPPERGCPGSALKRANALAAATNGLVVEPAVGAVHGGETAAFGAAVSFDMCSGCGSYGSRWTVASVRLRGSSLERMLPRAPS